MKVIHVELINGRIYATKRVEQKGHYLMFQTLKNDDIHFVPLSNVQEVNTPNHVDVAKVGQNIVAWKTEKNSIEITN